MTYEKKNFKRKDLQGLSKEDLVELVLDLREDYNNLVVNYNSLDTEKTSLEWQWNNRHTICHTEREAALEEENKQLREKAAKADKFSKKSIITEELREDAQKDHEDGMTVRQIAAKYGVSVGTAHKLIKRDLKDELALNKRNFCYDIAAAMREHIKGVSQETVEEVLNDNWSNCIVAIGANHLAEYNFDMESMESLVSYRLVISKILDEVIPESIEEDEETHNLRMFAYHAACGVIGEKLYYIYKK